MKTLVHVFAATLAIAAAVPALAQTSTQPRDVGNMAYPAPLPQGATTNTMPGQTRDTSSAAYPNPLPQGNIGTTTTQGPRKPTDTGNMAYPTPLPQGNVGTTTTK